jgi:hypothetical protein
VRKTHKQRAYACETCGLNKEGYFGPEHDGFYDDKMVWHPSTYAESDEGLVPPQYTFTEEFCRDSGLDGI